MTTHLKNGNLAPLSDLLSIFDKPTLTRFWERMFPTLTRREERLRRVGLFLVSPEGDIASQLSELDGIDLSPDDQAALKQLGSETTKTGCLIGPFLVLPLESEGAPLLALIGQRAALALMGPLASDRLSPAEQRVVLQIVSGQVLRDAATVDDVSYETKRNQLRSAMGKLECNRQSDIVRIFLQGLVARMGGSTSSATDTDFLEHYCDQFLPKEDVRTHVIRSETREDIRVLDVGPRDGLKVLGVHPHVMPKLTPADVAVLQRHKLRVIWPIRPGAFTAQDPDLVPIEHRKSALRGLESISDAMFDGPSPLVASVDGTNYAIEFMDDHPDAVSQAVFIGFAGVLPGHKLVAGKIRRGAIRLATRAPQLLKRGFDHYSDSMQDVSKLQAAVEKMFTSSPVDHDVIRQEFLGPDGGRDFQMRVLGSVGTIRQDLMYQAINLTPVLRRTKVPLTFIHGALDAVQPASRVQDFVTALGKGTLVTLPDCGQLIYGAHFEKSVVALMDALTARD